MSANLIDQIEVFRLRLQLLHPWQTAYGTETVVETLYARALAGDREAWYESCPLRFPDYLPDCAAATFAVLTEHLAPRLIGTPPSQAAQKLAMVRGNCFARNLLIGAAALLDQPPDPASPAGAVDAPISSITLALRAPDLIDKAARLSHRRLRVKFVDPSDLERLRQLRLALPDTAIAVDCNAAFRLPDDLALLQQLDELDLAFIEQPLHYRDLVQHAQLQQTIATPICLDESLTCLEDAATAIAIGAARVFNLKVGRLGGPDVLMRVLDLAREANVDCFIGGMLESPLGTLQNARLARLPGITLPSDLPDSHERYQALPVDFHVTQDHNGRVTFPPNATVDRDQLAPFILESATIGRD